MTCIISAPFLNRSAAPSSGLRSPVAMDFSRSALHVCRPCFNVGPKCWNWRLTHSHAVVPLSVHPSLPAPRSMSPSIAAALSSPLCPVSAIFVLFSYIHSSLDLIVVACTSALDVEVSKDDFAASAHQIKEIRVCHSTRCRGVKGLRTFGARSGGIRL